MALRGGPHERRLTVCFLLDVDACAFHQQRFHRTRLTCARAGHQHCFAVHGRGVRIGAGRQQTLDHGAVAVRAGKVQRRKAVVVGDCGARAGANQQVGDREIVDMGGPVKRGRAVALWRIHIDALLDERADRRGVLAAHGLDEAWIGASGGNDRLRPGKCNDKFRYSGHHSFVLAVPPLAGPQALIATISSRPRARCCRRTCPSPRRSDRAA